MGRLNYTFMKKIACGAKPATMFLYCDYIIVSILMICKIYLQYKSYTTTRHERTLQIGILIWRGSSTHKGRVTYICVGNLTTIASEDDLLPSWHQAFIWTCAGILLIKPLRTNFSDILMEIHIFSFTNMQLNMSSIKGWPFCLVLNVVMLANITFPRTWRF